MNYGAFFLICLFLFSGIIGSIGAAPKKYLFFEQTNDCCIFAPMGNLKRLEKLKREYPQAFGDGELSEEESKSTVLSLFRRYIPADQFYSKRDWLARAYVPTTGFYTLMPTEVTAEVSPESSTPGLDDFIRLAVTYGPVTPHFYLKDDGGKMIAYIPEYKTNTLLPSEVANIKGYSVLMLTPFILIDGGRSDDSAAVDGASWSEKLRQLTYEHLVMLPGGITKESKKIYLLNQETLNFDTFDFDIEEKPEEAFARHAYSDDKYKWLEKHSWTVGNPVDHRLGFKQYLLDYKLGRVTYDGHNYSTSLYGLAKLSYLRLGIGHDNKPLVPGAEDDDATPEEKIKTALVKAHQELKERSNASSGNWWGDEYFSTDKYLNYHIVRYLETHPVLMKKFEAVVDFDVTKKWNYYEKFVTALKAGLIYKDKNGTKKLDPKMAAYFMLSKEQALACVILCQLRDLWYALHSDAAYYHATFDTEDFANSFFMRLGFQILTGLNISIDEHIRAARAKKHCIIEGADYTLSFIDAWKELLLGLKTAEHVAAESGGKSARTDWICFDSHGWVLSWDPALIRLQREHYIYKRSIQEAGSWRRWRRPDLVKLQLLDELGFAGIESWLSGDLKLFYVQD